MLSIFFFLQTSTPPPSNPALFSEPIDPVLFFNFCFVLLRFLIIQGTFAFITSWIFRI